MLDETQLADTLRVVRPMLKGHIRQTRTLLAVLTELDKDLDRLVTTRDLRELDQRMANGGVANGKAERQTVG